MGASIFDTISTGDIDLLSGGINIGNHGMSDAQVKAIFGSLAAAETAKAAQEKQQRQRTFLLVGGSVVALIALALIIFFFTSLKS